MRSVNQWLDHPATRTDSLVVNSLLFLVAAWFIGGAALQIAPRLAPRLFWTEAPVPSWVETFARAWCAGDAEAIAPRLGGKLATSKEELAAEIRAEWPGCDGVHYLGGGSAQDGTFYVYTFRTGQDAIWYVFLVRADKVVRID